MTDLPYELPEYVSPSSLATYSQCPLKYKYSRVNKIAEPPTKAALLGNFVHDVLESFYGQLAPEERTALSLRSLSTSTWTSGDWDQKISGIVPQSEKNDFRWNAWWCLENIFSVEKPINVDVSSGGVETELNGKVGEVPVRGFIDRWVVEDGVIKISDYKTGKTPKERYVGDKFVQLFVYAAVLENDDSNKVDLVELLYLKDGARFSRKFDDDARISVLNEVSGTYSRILESFSDNSWSAHPTQLCYWCHYKTNICEYWKGKPQ